MLDHGNSKVFLVNRSGSNIPVYEELVHSSYHTGSVTAGGDQIGTIYPNEFYLVFKNDSYYVSSYKIGFRNSNGNFAIGYIETCPGYSLDDYAWAKYQEPYHYYNSNGSTLVESATETIQGKTYRIFTVKKTVNAVNSSGSGAGSLSPGTKLATLASTAGSSKDQYMIFYKKKVGTGNWVDLVSSGTYGFVDLDLSTGSMPSNRAIY